MFSHKPPLDSMFFLVKLKYNLYIFFQALQFLCQCELRDRRERQGTLTKMSSFNTCTLVLLLMLLYIPPTPSLSSQLKYWTTEEVIAGPPRADDDRVIEFVKSNGFLIPPSNKPYNYKPKSEGLVTIYESIVKKVLNNQVSELNVVFFMLLNMQSLSEKNARLWNVYFTYNVVQFKRDGFFIECGAHDGVSESNTLELERNYGWKVRIFSLTFSRCTGRIYLYRYYFRCLQITQWQLG